jgi:hypothetical protein
MLQEAAAATSAKRERDSRRRSRKRATQAETAAIKAELDQFFPALQDNDAAQAYQVIASALDSASTRDCVIFLRTFLDEQAIAAAGAALDQGVERRPSRARSCSRPRTRPSHRFRTRLRFHA